MPPRRVPGDRPDQARRVDSPLLSAFFHRPIKHRAAVILPERPKAERKAADGLHHPGLRRRPSPAPRCYVGDPRIELRRRPDPRRRSTPTAGPATTSSPTAPTNGPRGRALIEEFIPYLEKNFPMIAEPAARLLNGHSSGGWSSLWLQVTYPDFFGGTWSTSPDPVDFRDFQRIDIYATGSRHVTAIATASAGRSPGWGRRRCSSTTASRRWSR